MSRLTLYADGAARGNPGQAGSGAALVDERGEVVAEVMRFLGHTTNNVAEYTALIIGLEEARRRGIEELDVRMDSEWQEGHLPDSRLEEAPQERAQRRGTASRRADLPRTV